MGVKLVLRLSCFPFLVANLIVRLDRKALSITFSSDEILFCYCKIGVVLDFGKVLKVVAFLALYLLTCLGDKVPAGGGFFFSVVFQEGS